MKTCNKCGLDKELAGFYKDKRNKSGYRGKCKSCTNTVVKEYANKNKDEISKKQANYYKENKAKVSKRNTEWRLANLGKRASYCAKYRATKLKATPLWADFNYISLFYKGAKLEEIRTGRKVHVDHIVPLQGKLVCGLHCPDNLQLLFAEDNRAKSNKHD